MVFAFDVIWKSFIGWVRMQYMNFFISDSSKFVAKSKVLLGHK